MCLETIGTNSLNWEILNNKFTRHFCNLLFYNINIVPNILEVNTRKTTIISQSHIIFIQLKCKMYNILTLSHSFSAKLTKHPTLTTTRTSCNNTKFARSKSAIHNCINFSPIGFDTITTHHTHSFFNFFTIIVTDIAFHTRL